MRDWLNNEHGSTNFQTDPDVNRKMSYTLQQHLNIQAEKVQEWISKYHKQGEEIQKSEFSHSLENISISRSILN